MRKLTKILSITALACSLVVTAKAETVNPFDDVNSSFWGYSTIEWGIQKNMVSGYPDKPFKPNQSVKESEFLSMLLRYYANNTEQLTFETGRSHWAELYYKRAKEYNVPVSQTASNKPIKRGEVAKLIAATQGFNYNTNNSVQLLYNEGISSGRQGTSK